MDAWISRNALVKREFNGKVNSTTNKSTYQQVNSHIITKKITWTCKNRVNRY